eukprot:Em0005g187a
MNMFSKGFKELQEEVNKLKVERDQAWSTSEKLETRNNELRDSSNVFSSQLALALKEKDTLQLQLKAMDKILEERSTKDAECIQSLESQLFQKKQQLKDLIEKQDKRTPSSTARGGAQAEFDGQDKPPGLVGAHKDLLTKMWSGAHQSLRAEQLAHEMAKICDYFDGKSSQDAQEFLGCLLENLHDNIKTAQAKMPRCTRTREVIKAPEILMLHLKRFKRMKQKVETPVDFPLNGLELFTSNTLSRYNLFAVINHSGSMFGGCWQKHIESSTEDLHTLIAFIHLLNDMGTGQGASSSFKKDIMCLSSGFERKAQQDSHEFIISLLDKMKFQVALKWWLGIPVVQGKSCPHCPSFVLDDFGHHSLSYFCQRACLGPRLEMGCGAGYTNPQSRPADVLVPNWDLGKPAAFDLSVTSTLHPSVLLEASMTAAVAAFSKLAGRLSTRLNQPKSKTIFGIYSRLGLALVRANCRVILSRLT